MFKNFLKGDFRETNDIYIETSAYQGVEGIDYHDPEKDWIGSHAVVIVGWGEDIVNDVTVSYWIVRNSWGTSWGINQGLFKIAMYGTTGLQNRISQFEYPSLITTDTGVGVTGGIIMIKAGRIVPAEVTEQTKKISNKSSMSSTPYCIVKILSNCIGLIV